MAEMGSERVAPDPPHQFSEKSPEHSPEYRDSERRDLDEEYKITWLRQGNGPAHAYIYHHPKKGTPEIIGKVDTTFNLKQDLEAQLYASANGLQVKYASTTRNGSKGPEKICTYRILEGRELLIANILLKKELGLRD